MARIPNILWRHRPYDADRAATQRARLRSARDFDRGHGTIEAAQRHLYDDEDDTYWAWQFLQRHIEQHFKEQ